MQTLIDSWPLTPTFVVNRNMGILASNRLAQALSRVFSPGENILRAAFLEPEMRMLYRDWDRVHNQDRPVLASRARSGATRSRTRRAHRRTQPRRASDSPHCGRVTTSSIEAPVRPPSTIRKSGRSICTTRSCTCRINARCSSPTTPTLAHRPRKACAYWQAWQPEPYLWSRRRDPDLGSVGFRFGVVQTWWQRCLKALALARTSRATASTTCCRGAREADAKDGPERTQRAFPQGRPRGQRRARPSQRVGSEQVNEHGEQPWRPETTPRDRSW